MTEKNPFVPHFQASQRPILKYKSNGRSSSLAVFLHKQQKRIRIKPTSPISNTSSPRASCLSLIKHTNRKMSPAIYNNILAVSNISRRTEMKRDVTKTVRFGTMTIVKNLGVIPNVGRFKRQKPDTVTTYMNSLKLKFKSIRTLIKKFPSKFLLLNSANRCCQTDFKGISAFKFCNKNFAEQS